MNRYQDLKGNDRIYRNPEIKQSVEKEMIVEGAKEFY